MKINNLIGSIAEKEKAQSHNLLFFSENIEKIMKEYAEWYAKECLKISADKAEVYFHIGEGEIFSSTYISDDDYKYVNFDSLPSFQVNKDSILDIELPNHEP